MIGAETARLDRRPPAGGAVSPAATSSAPSATRCASWRDVAAPLRRARGFSQRGAAAGRFDRLWRLRGRRRRPSVGGARRRRADRGRPTRREEALALAIAMREALETPGKTAALITPDPDHRPPRRRRTGALGHRGRQFGGRHARSHRRPAPSRGSRSPRRSTGARSISSRCSRIRWRSGVRARHSRRARARARTRRAARRAAGDRRSTTRAALVQRRREGQAAGDRHAHPARKRAIAERELARRREPAARRPRRLAPLRALPAERGRSRA